MKVIYSSIISLFLGCATYAQSSITGTIVNQNQSPIDFSEVSLLNQKQELIQHIYTAEDGKFEFSSILDGEYLLQIQYFGNIKYNYPLSISENADLGVIELELAEQLNEVVLSTKAKVFERKQDRTVFNIENSIYATNTSLVDLLKVTPGIQVDDSKITQVGRSTMQVMINDRLVQLSGEDLINYLSTIKSENIKKIEVITTPPAKYDASGASGLINIVLKEAKLNAWSNQISSNVKLTSKALWSFSDVFNYNKNKFSLSANLNYAKGDVPTSGNMKLYYPTETWFRGNSDVRKDDKFFGRIQANYKLTDKTTIGAQYIKSSSNDNVIDGGTTNIYNVVENIVNNPVENLDRKLRNDGKTKNIINNEEVNLNITHLFDTLKTKLTVDMDYFTYKNDRNRLFNTKKLDVNNIINSEEKSQTYGLQNIESYSIKADMEQPLSWATLSYGAKANFVTTTNETGLIDLNNKAEAISTDHFVYKENIQAGYISLAKEFNTKWSSQIGLRLENTQVKGQSITTSSTNDIKYTKLFPTLYITYNLNDENNFSFNYNKRIDRPSFWELNPFKWYVNEFTYMTGNPNIKPSYTNNLELSYTFNGTLFITAGYSHTKNNFVQYSQINTATNTQVFTHDNIFDINNYFANITYAFNKISWFSSQNSLSVFHNDPVKIKDVDLISKSGTGYYFTSNNVLFLNETKTFKAQVDFWYQSAIQYTMWKFSAPTYSFNLGAKYSMLNKALNFSIYANDIFNNQVQNITTTSNGVKQEIKMNNASRYVTLGVSYSFGNKNIKVKEHQRNNNDVQNRL